jgi:hypothetical protein
MTRTLPLLVFVTACLPDFPKRDFTEDPTHDGDGDGVTELDGDCDDAEPLAYPGADEVCDGIDNDCDGDADEDDALDAVIWYSDGDRDGFGTDAFTVKACAAPSEAYTDNDDDCDDSVAAINPNAVETCAEFDEDCDGFTNEGEGDTGGAGSTLDTDTWYKDADHDGYGRDDETIESCDRPEGYVLDGGDCDDGNPDISPRETEQCDGIDNDCDTLIDDDDPGMVGEGTWYADTDGDGFGNPVGETLEQCAQPDGHVLDATDCDDGNAEFNPDGVETCNEVDDDCDGVVDDGVKLDFFADSDADGFGDLSSPTEACAVPDGYTTDFTDCDDSDPLVNPDAAEQCATEGIDDNCDGRVDESDASDALTWHLDADGDGFGDADATLVQCTEPASYVADGTDCDDARATSHPDAVELCGTPTRDDDCDGDTNDDGADGCSTYWYDGDDDGYGDALLSRCQCVSDDETGYTSDRSDDCDDTQSAVHPERGEDCGTAEDDNCNGDTNDEGAAGCVAYWRDVDEDGFGVEGDLVCVCTPFEPYDALAGGDCADLDGAVHPDADEVCFDDTDNDCDGLTDDSTSSDASIWYQDSDGDDYGVAALTETACAQPEGYTDTTGDCDDTREGINPGVENEDCLTIWDDDCSGSTNDVDASACTVFYADEDGDGYGWDGDTQCTCEADTTTVYTSRVTGDCDDGNTAISPGDTEVCDADDVDEDCDGSADPEDAEGCTTYFYDFDGDGFGVNDTRCLCEASGYYDAATLGDCDDYDITINPDEENCGLHGPVDFDLAAAKIVGRAVSRDWQKKAMASLDYDRDGTPDFVLGNAGETHTFHHAGGVYLWLGPMTGLHSVGPSSDADLVFVVDDELDRRVGVQVSAGDVDGDGYDEVLVACGDNWSYGSNNSYLLDDGLTGLGTVTPSTPGVTTFVGGIALLFGDINADGYDDGWVSRHRDSSPKTGYFAYGSSAGLVVSETDSTHQMCSNGTGVGCGNMTSGDLDGDGAADLVVYGPDRAFQVFAGGEDWDPDGATSSFTGSLLSDADVSVRVVGDVTGDGRADVAIGFGYVHGAIDPHTGTYNNYIGNVWVFEGGLDETDGPVLMGPESTATDLDDAAVQIVGDFHLQYFGFDVAGAGDVNGDEFGDLLLTSGSSSGSHPQTVLWYGPLPTSGSIFSFLDGDATFVSKQGVSPAGDVNDDGYDDIWVGGGTPYLYHGTP